MDFEALEKLADLKQKGIINEEEFNQKKKELLNVQEKLSSSPQTSTLNDNSKVSSSNFNISNYYQEEFNLIKNSNEDYKGKFNWFAFVLNFLWFFFKGLPKPGTLFLLNNFLWIIIVPIIGTQILLFFLKIANTDELDGYLFTTIGLTFSTLWTLWNIPCLLISSYMCGKEATYRYYTRISKE